MPKPRLLRAIGNLFAAKRPAKAKAAKPKAVRAEPRTIALAITGCLLRRDLMTRSPHLWTFPAFILLAHLPMWTESRRLLPAIPCLIALAVAGMEAIAARRAKLGT